MSDRSWKAEERGAAALFGGTHCLANTGGAADFESRRYLGQVKHVQRLSLPALEALALDAQRTGAKRVPPKAGVMVVQLRAGRARKTPRPVVFIEHTWRGLQERATVSDAPKGDTDPTLAPKQVVQNPVWDFLVPILDASEWGESGDGDSR